MRRLIRAIDFTPLWALIAVLAVGTLALFSSFSFRECLGTYAQNTQASQLRDYLSGFAWCVAEFVNTNQGLITAIAAFMTAVFTATLWWSTRALWKAGERQLISANRPHITVHSVEPSHLFEETEDVEQARIAAFITYYNKGYSPAVVTEIRGKITNRVVPLQSGIELPLIMQREKKIESGVPTTILIPSDMASTRPSRAL